MKKTIGGLTFWTKTHSQEHGKPADAFLSSDVDTDEYLLCIRLGTSDEKEAPKKAEQLLECIAVAQDL